MLKALKITPRNWSIYANLMVSRGLVPSDRATMNGRFLILDSAGAGTPSLGIYIYDEIDFRTRFRWVGVPQETKFVEVAELSPDEEGEYAPWEPGREDLGAV